MTRALGLKKKRIAELMVGTIEKRGGKGQHVYGAGAGGVSRAEADLSA